ncbi:acyltransferase [Gordonia sp. HY442]|uniref:acyltransferase family protein n=1 Tax=Gordonia zhenghanii TaxID=2911516 RepID=UPI001F242B6F|nr:acyltransferase family protein [Gordonia zhenghanii]MCF8605880.1 acyltransferase [Gordonia zhenghanii]
MTDSTPDVRPAYRTDLDGLRGVAIALVACFHVWFGKVSGGVDVFLTLSGYFFVGSLLRHAIASADPVATFRDTLNPWPRLSRLLRRLLPALITVLIAVAIGTLILLPQTRWVSIGREIIASALYFQNYFLAWNSQDYLAASSDNSPLQHLWSMSMQGQFFVATMLFALVLAAVLKLLGTVLPAFTKASVIRTVIGVVVVVIAAASFYHATSQQGSNQPYNYYDTLARLWEPLVGGLLAVWTPRVRLPSWLRTLITVGALALIVSSGWWIDGVAEYPGPMTWVPVGATLLIIWSGSGTAPRPAANRVLASRQGVWLGNLAYSLYLIHWPLLIFYLAHADSDHATFIEGTCILAVSLGIAWLVKRYVEEPLRGGSRSPLAARHWPGRPRIRYAAILSAFLVLGAAVVGTGAKLWEHHMSTVAINTDDIDPHLYPGARAWIDEISVPARDPQPTPLAAEFDLAPTTADGVMSDFDDLDFHVGVYGDPNAERTIAVAGGSHAEMWVPALDVIGKRNGFKVTTYLKMGCPLTLEENPTRIDGTPYPECTTWVRKVLDELERVRPDAVFTNSTRPRPDGPADYVPPGYLEVFDELTAAGLPVIAIRDTPWPHDDEGRPVNTPGCLADGGDAQSCGSERAPALAPVDPITDYALLNPLLHPLDLSDHVCDDTFCPAIVGNIIVYKDFHHLGATYVRSLSSALSRALEAALPWTGPSFGPFH